MMSSATRTERFFCQVTSRPWLVSIIATLLIVGSGTGLTQLVKDTSLKAFIPPDHEALIADARATEIFGLSDSIAVAVISTDGRSIFRAETFGIVTTISDQMADIENVRYGRITSLATESSISGDDGAVNIEPYIDAYADRASLDENFVARSQERWQRMTPHQETLVSADGRGAIIMAELVDSDLADDTYMRVQAIIADLETPGIAYHVAGPGAVSGYLSRYIDKDAGRLVPIGFLLIIGFIYLAFRRFSALPGPLLVVIGSTAGALGLMAWSGVSYFAITNALPIVIVAISVADAIHVLSEYYKLREQDPKADNRTLVIRAMTAMARPISLTTITTIAGFLGITAMSIMPPIFYFGLFAALGVFLAWAFSIFVLPNIMLLANPGRSPAFVSWRENRPGRLGYSLGKLAAYSLTHFRSVLAGLVLVTLFAVYGASQLRIDRSQVENFKIDEPIRVADSLINERFAGTAFLDVIVSAKAPEGLLQINMMRKVRDLQAYFDGLPHVRKTVSIVDYVSQLHGAINDLDQAAIAARELPGSDATLAETLFVYEISGDPTDLEEEIDADYQHALIRGVLDAHYFSQNRVAVESLQRYIDDHFNSPNLTASLAGDVNVSYHWMSSLQTSHFKGVALSLMLVLLASVAVFRSPLAGLISVVPVLFTVLVLYACMGYLGIYLEPATSMFAAIALGVGVDFGIHLVERLREATREAGGDLERAVADALPPVARACFFNSTALGLGFSVLAISELATLTRFGGLIALAAFASFVTALIIVPAMLGAQHAWFRGQKRATNNPLPPATIGLLLIAGVMLAALSPNAKAANTDADGIAHAIATRAEGLATKRIIDMTLTNRRGRTEKRVAIVHKQNNNELRATRITFLAPKKSKDVSFLSFDYRTPETADKRWMFLPAARKSRQVPASQRGKNFLGTDFSYEDMQSELKFDLGDWRFTYGGVTTTNGSAQHRLSGQPSSQKIARELGYGGFEAIIDEETWMPIAIDFVDPKQRPLKTIEVHDVELIEEIWTAKHVVATNHQTGHSTEFIIRDVVYSAGLDNRLFEPQTLGRGLGSHAPD